MPEHPQTGGDTPCICGRCDTLGPTEYLGMTISYPATAAVVERQEDGSAHPRLTGDAALQPQTRLQQPVHPPAEDRRLNYASIDAPRLTHYLFRYPAKFHPPVAHALIRSYTVPGNTVLDPFCGSGTLLVTAAVEGRRAIGSDVDPLAVFISKVKTHGFNPKQLQASWSTVHPLIQAESRSAEEYAIRQFQDVPVNEYEDVLSNEQLWVPNIPNLQHWFRRYVIIDLARIFRSLKQAYIPETHRRFLFLIFASIIRKSSNADPVPVSGLEVTSYMKTLDQNGRIVNPFHLFIQAAKKGLIAAEAYKEASSQQKISVRQADARSLCSSLKTQVDAVITSPPYHNAVDYYRRHQLEMYWLGLTTTRADRLGLLPQYIGRSRVSNHDPLLEQIGQLGPLSNTLYQHITTVSEKRAHAFAHYMLSMQITFKQLATIARPHAPIVFVVGHSEWNGTTIPTSDLFVEMAGRDYELVETFWYPFKNRYMSYGRHNGANIDKEHIVVLRRRNA